MSGGFFRGTSADQDSRFSNKMSKLLKSQKFAPELDVLVEMSKVNMDVIKPWIATRVTELLGFEDEVLINFIYGLLDVKDADGKHLQIQLTGFMEKNTGRFMKELWGLLTSAQSTISGIPQQFLDAKAEEAKKKKDEKDRILSELMRKKEEQEKDAEEERQRKLSAKEESSKANSDKRGPSVSPSRGPDGKPPEVLGGSGGRNGRSVRRISASPHRSASESSSRSRGLPVRHRRPRSISRSPPRRRRSGSFRRRSPLKRRSPLPLRSPPRRRRSPFYSRSPPRRRKSPPLRTPPRIRSRSPPRNSRRSPVIARSNPRHLLSPPMRRRSPTGSASPGVYRSPSRSPYERRRSPSRDRAIWRSPSRDHVVRQSPSKDLVMRQSPSRDGTRRSLSRDRVIRGSPSRGRVTRRSFSRDRVIRRSASKERVIRRSASRDRGIRWSPSRDRGIRRSASRDRGIWRSPRRDRGMRPSPSRDRGMRQSPSRDRGMRQSPSRDRGMRQTLVRDQSMRQSPSRDRAIRGSPIRNRIVRGSPRRDHGIQQSPSKVPAVTHRSRSPKRRRSLSREQEFQLSRSPYLRSPSEEIKSPLKTFRSPSQEQGRRNGFDARDRTRPTREGERIERRSDRPEKRELPDHRRPSSRERDRVVSKEGLAGDKRTHHELEEHVDIDPGQWERTESREVGKMRVGGKSIAGSQGPLTLGNEVKKTGDRKEVSAGLAIESDEEDVRPPKAQTAPKRMKDVADTAGEEDGSESPGSSEERHEAKRRRKEEKRLRKEEKRKKREERHRRREEKRAAKALKEDIDVDDEGENLEDRPRRACDNHRGSRDALEPVEEYRSMDEETEDEQKRIERELRNKALESLRAKKGIAC